MSPQPSQEAADLLGFLTAIASMQRSSRPEHEYAGIEDIVLRHGRYFEAQSLPPEYERMKAKECFTNALTLALHRDLVYCEGYAGGRVSIPIHHAWALDERGRVVDPTWKDPEDCTYYGIPLELDYVSRVVAEKGTDTVFDWQRGKDLFCHPLPEEAIADV